DLAAMAVDQPLAFKIGEHAIDVYRGLARNVCDLLLRERVDHGAAIDIAASPDRGLAQEVRHPGSGIAAAAVHQPFVADRLAALDQTAKKSMQLRVRINDRIEIRRA